MKRLALLILALCLMMFAGCGQQQDYVPTGDALSWEDDYTGPETTKAQEEEQKLMLTYYPEVTMNPYACTDFTNRALLSLIYQSLFATDRDYNVEPQLCSRYRVSEDMKVYTFYLEQATFSDGQVLTAQDVVASLNAARESDYYGGRFQYLADLSISDDGGVRIQMAVPYENLPLLLDIPIVKEEEVEEMYPLGTGPYVLNRAGEQASLVKQPHWWCSTEMVLTAPTIPLMKAESTTQIRDAFEFRGLSLVCADPGSDKYADYRCDFELWDCETGDFVYLTTSRTSTVFSVPEVRAALTHAIDRDYLVDTFYRGFARSACLPASPRSPFYSQTLAEHYGYDSTKFAEALRKADMRDQTVVLLVNSDDSLRVRVARSIAKMLEDCGLKVQMSELSGVPYQIALKSWNFDLFLGQTKLSPNMDLTQFFNENGVLSWGGVDNPTLYSLCHQALENHGNYYTLHKTVMDSSALCPVLFGSNAVFATRGLITGLTPSRDNVFYYSLGKTMEDALLEEDEQVTPAETTVPSETEETNGTISQPE